MITLYPSLLEMACGLNTLSLTSQDTIEESDKMWHSKKTISLLESESALSQGSSLILTLAF